LRASPETATMPTADTIRPTADPEAVRRLVRLGLTEKQAQVYLYIFTTAMECGYQPSLRDMMAYMGVTSPNSIALIINSLEISGFVKRKKSEGRCLVLKKCPDGRPFSGFRLPEDAS
jgi:DNA-binding MarR family transcriptional regulator